MSYSSLEKQKTNNSGILWIFPYYVPGFESLLELNPLDPMSAGVIHNY